MVFCLCLVAEDTAAREWKLLCDKYVHLNKHLNQSCSGAPGIEILSCEDADFVKCMSFLQQHINRRKWWLCSYFLWSIENGFDMCMYCKQQTSVLFMKHFVDKSFCSSTTGNFGPGCAETCCGRHDNNSWWGCSRQRTWIRLQWGWNTTFAVAIKRCWPITL